MYMYYLTHTYTCMYVDVLSDIYIHVYIHVLSDTHTYTCMYVCRCTVRYIQHVYIHVLIHSITVLDKNIITSLNLLKIKTLIRNY